MSELEKHIVTRKAATSNLVESAADAFVIGFFIAVLGLWVGLISGGI
jgi:hypothetical protein